MYSGYGHPQMALQQQPYYVYQGQMPLTPMDFSYSQLMLPGNLLSASPSPYVNRQTFVPLAPPSPLYYPRIQPFYPQNGYLKPLLPYLTQPTTNTSLDQLNLSRTVILKNLAADLLLSELLNEVDYGPIEYCKMFEVPAPDHFKDVQTLKTCYISFVNTQISVSFHYKYGKNSYNLRLFRERLKNSKYLKITLNEPAAPSAYSTGSNNLSKQDFIKLKTLNYILEFNATRAVMVKFKVASMDLVPTVTDEFRAKCSKTGEVEDFKTSIKDDLNEVKYLVHFTSIDSAIKLYEFHLKRIQIDHLNLLDLEGGEVIDIMCVAVNFHRDRCDRTEINKTRQQNPKSSLANGASSASSSVASSPPTSRRGLSTLIPPVPEAYDLPDSENLPLQLPTDGSPSIVPESDNTIEPYEVEQESNQETLAGAVFEPSEGQKVYQTSLESSSSNELNSLSSNIASDPTEPTHNRSKPNLPSEAYMYPQMTPYPVSNQSANSSIANLTSYQFNPDPFNVGNRTLYLGNLHPNTTVEEIANNVRAGGLVESFKFYRLKRMCFVTFVDPAVALKFYLNHQVLHQLIVHGHDVFVSWGKNHSGPLHRDIALAVTAGASRNVYIGIKLKDIDNPPTVRLPTEAVLREDFSRFGEMEQINFYHNKDCGFMNFMNISDAIKVVECFDSCDVEKISDIVGDNGEFYEKYLQFKISFGKDRCGNPPKFSFKKKNASFDFYKEKELSQSPKQRSKDILVEEKEKAAPMSKEAAMVFGISTESSPEPLESSSDNGTEAPHPEEYLAESTTLEVEPKETETSEGEEKEVLAQDKPVASSESVKDGNESEKAADEASEVEDDDDEDNISIIIDADTSPSKSHAARRTRRKPQKIYHNKFDLTDGFNLSYSSRNSSNVSANSSFANHGNFHPANYSPAPQHIYYHQTPPMPPMMGSSGYYNGNQKYQHMVQPSYGAGSGVAPQFAFSGSQVMAQYLAKSQHDNFVYASSILNNDVSSEELRDYRRATRRTHRK